MQLKTKVYLKNKLLVLLLRVFTQFLKPKKFLNLFKIRRVWFFR